MDKSHVLHALHFADASALGGAELQALSLMDRIPRDRYQIN